MKNPCFALKISQPQFMFGRDVTIKYLTVFLIRFIILAIIFLHLGGI